MSSNLYIRKKPDETEKNSFYELKFLMRRLLDTDVVDTELDESNIPVLTAAMVTTEDQEIANALDIIITKLENGEILIAKEEY